MYIHVLGWHKTRLFRVLAVIRFKRSQRETREGCAGGGMYQHCPQEWPNSLPTDWACTPNSRLAGHA